MQGEVLERGLPGGNGLRQDEEAIDPAEVSGEEQVEEAGPGQGDGAPAPQLRQDQQGRVLPGPQARSLSLPGD